MQTEVQAFQLVESQKALDDFYHDNEKAPWMAFDTEFVGEKRFVTRLCLIQAATEKGNYLIDPFAITDLTPFLDLVQKPDCIKITHAGDNDYRLLYTLYGITPRNVFDTQIAAGFAGYKHPVAFRKLVEQELGRSLDKGYAVTDWEARPFHKKQLAYALDDVLPLYPIWQRLQERLRKRNRFHWQEEECRQLENAASYIKDHEQELINSNLMKSLRPKERLFFLRLMTWRRDLAEKKNYSKEMILPERYLAVLARGIASGKEALLHNRRVPDKMIEQHGSLFESFYRQEATESERALLAQVVSQEESEDPQEEILLEMLYLLVRHKCLENDISVGMVMPKNLLRRLRADEEAGTLIQGWRKELLGEELTSWLLRINDLELHVEGGKIGLVGKS